MEYGNEKFKQIFRELKPLVEQIAFIHHQAYHTFKPEVENLVNSKTIDSNTIEILLDQLLDHACNNEVLILYKKVCSYYWYINPEATTNYINYYREMWDNENIKK